MLFLVTTRAIIGFVTADNIEQAERDAREWLNTIGIDGEVHTVFEDTNVVLNIGNEQVVVRPLPPLCELRSLTETPLSVGMERIRTKRVRYDEYLETL